MVSVLSVDDGNRETVGLSRLRPLEEKFVKLPCQALCCALSGVRPVNPAPQNTPGILTFSMFLIMVGRYQAFKTIRHEYDILPILISIFWRHCP